MKWRLRDWIHLLFIIAAFTVVGFIALSVSGCGGTRVPSVPGASGEAGGQRSIDTALVWLVTISVLGIGASIAAAVFLPIKKLAVAAIAGFGAILGSALMVKAALPFLPWVALGLMVLLVIAGILYFKDYVKAMHCAVGFGAAMEQASTDDDAKAVKERHATIQEAYGVRRLIDQTLNQFKAPAKPKV